MSENSDEIYDKTIATATIFSCDEGDFMNTVAFLVMISMVLLPVLGIAGLIAKKAISRRKLLVAREKLARPLLMEGAQIAGWNVEEREDEIILEKAFSQHPLAVSKIQLRTTLNNDAGLHVRIWREDHTPPEGARVEIYNLRQRVEYDDNNAKPRLLLRSKNYVRFQIDNRMLSIPIQTFGKHVLNENLVEVDPNNMRFEPDNATLEPEGLILVGKFFGEVLEAENLVRLERQLMTLLEMFSWKPDIDMLALISDTLSASPGQRAALQAAMEYGDRSSGEKQVTFWLSRLSRAPAEKLLSAHAFRRLVELGERERLGALLREQKVEFHKWLVSRGEGAAILWTIDLDEQRAKWLEFLLRDAPKLGRVFMDEHQARRHHAQLNETADLLSNIPLDLLVSPHISLEYRLYIIDFAIEHLPLVSSRDLFVKMTHDLKGRALHQFLHRVTHPLTEKGAIAIASIMARDLDPPAPIRDLILEHLSPAHQRYKWPFIGFDYMPWLHGMLTNEDADVRHRALAIARDIGGVSTLMYLVELRDSDRAGLDEGALGYAIEKLFEDHKDRLDDNMGRLSLAEAQGGELTSVDVGAGELSVIEPTR